MTRMQYFVIGPDGKEYGPATVDTLKEWVAQNRLGPQSMLKDFSSGVQLPASEVADLFPKAVATAVDPGYAPAYAAPAPSPMPAPAQPQQNWSSAPAPHLQTRSTPIY